MQRGDVGGCSVRTECHLCTGLEVLTAMEKVETDKDDRPKSQIRITGATIFVNPYKEMEEAEKKAAEEEKLKVLPSSILSST